MCVMASRKVGHLPFPVVYGSCFQLSWSRRKNTSNCDTFMEGKKLLPDSRLNYISSGIKTGVTLRVISTQRAEGGDEAIED